MLPYQYQPNDDLIHYTLIQIAGIAVVDVEQAAEFHRDYQQALASGDGRREMTIGLNVECAYNDALGKLARQ